MWIQPCHTTWTTPYRKPWNKRSDAAGARCTTWWSMFPSPTTNFGAHGPHIWTISDLVANHDHLLFESGPSNCTTPKLIDEGFPRPIAFPYIQGDIYITRQSTQQCQAVFRRLSIRKLAAHSHIHAHIYTYIYIYILHIHMYMYVHVHHVNMYSCLCCFVTQLSAPTHTTESLLSEKMENT